MRRSAPALALAALVCSGIVQTAIAPPRSWIALHAVAWVPALLVIARLRGRRAFLAGWLVGASANAAIFAWLVHTIAVFTPFGTAAGVVLLAGFAAAHGLAVAVFAWGFARVRGAAGPLWPLAIAVWFTACEFLGPQIFPYFQGVVWYGVPSLFLAAATTGVAGITFLVLLANSVVVQGVEVARARRGARALAGNFALLATLLVAALGAAAHQEARVAAAESDASALRIAIVQPGGDPERPPVRSRADAERLAAGLAARVERALARDPAIEVVMLPEKAIEWEPTRPWNRPLPALAQRFGIEIWTGGARTEAGSHGAPRHFNAAFRIRADGGTDPSYDKNVLVPFGEAMPLGGALDWLSDAIGRAPFTPGDGVPLFDAGPARFAFLICYEAILGPLARDPVRRGANLIVNPTYDGWFGDTAEPAQHLMLVAAQAAQLGVPILRAATTGISAFVDARGRIGPRAELFADETLVADVALLRVPGLYVAWGDWLAWGCVGVSALLLLRGPR